MRLTDAERAAARERRDNEVPGRPNPDPIIDYVTNVGLRAKWLKSDPDDSREAIEYPAIGRRADYLPHPTA